MKKKNKYKSTDQDVFQRYRSGDLTDIERNSFEKSLQSDPFAEEAFEGLEAITPEEAEQDSKILRAKIKRRIGRGRISFIYRIAASIAVLMIISSVFIVLQKNQTAKEGSLPVDSLVTLDIAKSDPVYSPDSELLQVPVRSSREQETPSVTEDREEIIEAKEGLNLADEEPVQFEMPVAEKHVEEAERIAAGDQVQAEERAAAQPAAALRARQASSDKKEAPATVSTEITVTGYGTLKNLPDSDDIEKGYIPPQPVGGTEAYKKYVAGNIIRPDSATTGQRVVVVVSFRVQENGYPDSIRIIRSPHKDFSDEAIRIIRSGPLWEPAKRNGKVIEEEVILRIVFP